MEVYNIIFYNIIYFRNQKTCKFMGIKLFNLPFNFGIIDFISVTNINNEG